MKKRCIRWSAVCAVVCFSAPAVADVTTQTDGRDYEALAYLQTNSLVPLVYFRDISSSDSQSYTVATGVFRAAYVLKFGNLAVVPLDFYVPVENITFYTPAGVLHASSIADVTYNPTLAYILTEDEASMTHTYFAVTPYITAPTGKYDPNQPVNVGTHRWAFQPQVAMGQRLAKFITVEAAANVSFHTVNDELEVPMLGRQSLRQKPTWGLDTHLTGDLSSAFYLGVSYYLVANGRSFFDLQTPVGTVDQTATNEQTVQTVRFTLGVRVTKQSLLLLQINQDVAASDGGTISRFFGARFSQIINPFSEEPADRGHPVRPGMAP
jgi:hypothetical protein